MIGLAIGFALGCLFAAWRFSVVSGPLLRQAERVARVFALESRPIGPELQVLSRLALKRRNDCA